MQTLLATNIRGSMIPISQQPSGLVPSQKSAFFRKSDCNGLSSMPTVHHPRWRLNTASLKGLTAAAAHSTASTQESDSGKNPIRGGDHFGPDIWGSHFLIYDDPTYQPENIDAAVKKEHEQLKEEVKMMMVKIQTTPITSKYGMTLKDRLKFMDTIQRLGVSFHFEKEIANLMQRVHEFDDFSSSDDLYTVAIAFHLLRDQGIYVPASIFDKFMDQIDGLDESSISSDDIDGLLALYESSFYVIPGEDVLDEAQELTANKLKSLLRHLTPSKHGFDIEKIEHVLYRSIRMNCERLVAKFYTTLYYKWKMLSFGESLLKFAVHDYNIRQFGFQKELAALTKWSEESNFKNTIPLSKHRLVEYHLWALCVYSEPQYNIARILFTKSAYLLTLMNDMYDTYGTMEELKLFTEAFTKLDPNASSELQPHMKALITAMIELYAEVEQHNPGKPYVVDYFKRECERLSRAYETIAMWIHSNTIPTFEEYFDVLIISGGLTILPCIYMLGMGDVVTEEAISRALDDPVPNYLRASATLTRLQDDLSLHSNEEDKPHSATRVFMKHYDVSEEEAREMIKQLVIETFKKKNKGLLKGQKDTLMVPRPILKAIYGEVQANDFLNRDRDTYSFPEHLKEFITLAFIEPIPI